MIKKATILLSCLLFFSTPSHAQLRMAFKLDVSLANPYYIYALNDDSLLIFRFDTQLQRFTEIVACKKGDISRQLSDYEKSK